MRELVRWLLRLPGDEHTVHECRHCGTTVDRETDPCPACGTTDIVRYHIT